MSLTPDYTDHSVSLYCAPPPQGTLGVQVFFETIMVMVFLWARTLARRAVPGDPSKEAKLLIWVIFLGDAYAELVRFRVDAVVVPIHERMTCCRLSSTSRSALTISGFFYSSIFL